MVERELGVGTSELGVSTSELGVGPSGLSVGQSGLEMGAGWGLSAVVDDSDPTWEDVEEEDEDLAAAMARKDEIDNGEIVGEVEETVLKDCTDYAVTTGRKVSHISISTEDFTDIITRSLRILYFAASRNHGS